MPTETEAERLERLDKEAARGQRMRRRSRNTATRYQQDMEDINVAPPGPAEPKDHDREK